MSVKYDEVVGFRAIANALEEDVRPGQRAFTPEDLMVAQHFDGGPVNWWYRGSTGYYDPKSCEVFMFTDERNLSREPSYDAKLRTDTLDEMTELVSQALRKGLTKEMLQADFDGMISVL